MICNLLIVKSDILLTESEKAYANRSWTLADFVLYNKTPKHPVLVIEVDGMAFHQVGSEQAKRDELKNSILDKAGIPLLRLTTDGSNEKNKIINACEYALLERLIFLIQLFLHDVACAAVHITPLTI